jgi:non-reducing end alpha-L-arabinofuranosidase
MKKIRSVVLVSFAVSLGAVVASCLSFSSNPNAGGAGGSGDPGGSGTGGSTGTTDTGGSTGTSDTGGAIGTADTGGSTGTSGTGGAIGTSGTGGSAGRAGVGGSTGTPGVGGSTGSGGATAARGPCDVLATAGNPCVAAHSTVRALYGSYAGRLYQVCRGAFTVNTDTCTGTIRDIGVVGGYADSAAQDTFCAGSSCVISEIYDQSPNGNHLRRGPVGGKGAVDAPAIATALPIRINGHAVYGVYIRRGMGYRAGCDNCTGGGPNPARGVATGDQPETIYMVTSQNGLIDGCCFDYGNAETDAADDGNGTMEAVYFGGGVIWGTGMEGGHTDSTFPWVMADLENGLFAGFSTTPPINAAQKITSNTALPFPFVTALIVGDTAAQLAGRGRFAIYGANATTGPLKSMYDGIRPTLGNYVPMRKQGSIILGIGGDNSNTSEGQWFEGVMASGAATLATVNAVQANIVAAKYGQ